MEQDMVDAEQPVVAVTSELATREAMEELATMTEKMTLDKKN